MIKLFLTSVAAACILATGCGPSRTSITLAGSTAFEPFAEKLAHQFMQKNPGVNVTVQGGGSAVGIQAVLSGAAQIGMVDLVHLPAETKHLHVFEVSRDGIAIVVAQGNKVANLTTKQVKDIFEGTIRNWSQVGGADHSITVVSREAGSGTRTSFEDILGGISLTKEAIIQNSNGTIRETVANDPNAIGYLSHGLVNEKIKAVALDGVECTTPLIMEGKYALVRPIYLLTKEAPSGSIKDLIDYILSPEGQETIKASGLVPVK